MTTTIKNAITAIATDAGYSGDVPTTIAEAIEAYGTVAGGGGGGSESDDVTVRGKLVFEIPDDDYDAGIEVTKELSDTLGTVLTMRGYANSTEQTSYRPLVRNIAEPVSAHDAATKKYVDDHVVVPTYHLVFLHDDGSVDTAASTLVYDTLVANLTNPTKADYLDVFWGSSRFYAKCVEVTDVNGGDLKFIADVIHDGAQTFMVFTLTPQDVLTTSNNIATFATFEEAANRAQSVTSNSSSTTKYPSTKAVYDEFQRKPVTVWEVDGETVTTGLTALETDMSANPAWQLTSLDLTPYKRVKVYTKAAQGTGMTASASTTPAIVLEMSLDPRAAITAYGGHYLGSTVAQKSNDRNRLATLCCAISADKTSFAVMRMTNLYGTGATDNADVGGYVFKIVGYYD